MFEDPLAAHSERGSFFVLFSLWGAVVPRLGLSPLQPGIFLKNSGRGKSGIKAIGRLGAVSAVVQLEMLKFFAGVKQQLREDWHNTQGRWEQEGPIPGVFGNDFNSDKDFFGRVPCILYILPENQDLRS